MSSKVIKYTAKLFSNLNTIRKRVDNISKLSGNERQREIDKLYRYFKRDTDPRIRLFTDSEDCINISECIDKDIEYLLHRCDSDLVDGEQHARCVELVNHLKLEFDKLSDKIIELKQEDDYVDEFIKK